MSSFGAGHLHIIINNACFLFPDERKPYCTETHGCAPSTFKHSFSSTHGKHTQGFICVEHRFCLEYSHTSKIKFKNATSGISKGRAKVLLFEEIKEENGTLIIFNMIEEQALLRWENQENEYSEF